MTTEGWIRVCFAALPALARVAGIVACAPPFAAPAVPRRVRAMLAIALAMGLSSAVGTAALPPTLSGAAMALVGEVLIGVAIGMGMSLLFAAAQWTGEIVASQLGLNLGESFDPGSSDGRSVLGQAYWLMSVVVFLGINGHHALVRGIQSSFESMPLFTVADGSNLLGMFVQLLSAATSLAVRLAVPVFVTMLIADLVVGMIGRTVPQVGLMTAGIAVRSIAGLSVLILSLALAATLIQGASGGWFGTLQTALTGR